MLAVLVATLLDGWCHWNLQKDCASEERDQRDQSLPPCFGCISRLCRNFSTSFAGLQRVVATSSEYFGSKYRKTMSQNQEPVQQFELLVLPSHFRGRWLLRPEPELHSSDFPDPRLCNAHQLHRLPAGPAAKPKVSVTPASHLSRLVYSYRISRGLYLHLYLPTD